MIKLPRHGTKTFEILQYIALHPGSRYIDIARFIQEDLYDREYQSEKGVGLWATNLYGFGSRRGLLPAYCEKHDGKWYVTRETAEAFDAHFDRMGCGSFAVFTKDGQTRTLREYKDEPVKEIEMMPPLMEFSNDGTVRMVYKRKPTLEEAIADLKSARDRRAEASKNFADARDALDAANGRVSAAEDAVRELLEL